jgi:putative oxidoreductase
MWSSRMLSVLRIVAALLFMSHGMQKILGFPGPARAPVEVFSLIGVAGVLELVGGALLLIGLFTRPVAFVLSGEMAFAYFLAHAPHGFWPIVNRGELAALYSFLFLYLMFVGGGEWSVDALRRRERDTGATSRFVERAT